MVCNPNEFDFLIDEPDRFSIAFFEKFASACGPRNQRFQEANTSPQLERSQQVSKEGASWVEKLINLDDQGKRLQ